MTQLVTLINNQAKTTSNIIADTFGKRHCDVLRKIDTLEMPEDFNRRNFASVEYMDEKGESRKAYEITRDGFTLLAMGFTGKKAMQFKIAYINAFNEMERRLMNPQGELGLVPVREYARRLPSGKKEIVLSDKARTEIGGIVKSCVNSAIRDAFQMFVIEPPKASKSTGQSKIEYDLNAAILAYGDSRERKGMIQGILKGAMNSEIVNLLQKAAPRVASR